MVKMNGVDLQQFQFDYDMTWAALFLHHDGTVYARYGSRTVDGPMVNNTAKGLVATMRRVLEAHGRYPSNRDRFLDKRGPEPRFRRAEDYPYLANRRGVSRVTHSNCIHCHDVHEAFHHAKIDEAGRPRRVFKYPLPENVGLEIELDSGNRVAAALPASPARAAGIEAGDTVLSMNGQAIYSIADIQFVLHHLPASADIAVDLSRRGVHVETSLRVEGDWRTNDFTWRVSLSGFPGSPGFYLRMLRASEKEAIGVGAEKLALEVGGLFTPAARRSGLRQGDIIIGIDGRADKLSAPKFHAYARVHHFRPGSRAKVEVLRDGKVRSVDVGFFE